MLSLRQWILFTFKLKQNMKEIDLSAGCDIKRAYQILTEASEKEQIKTWGKFNGKKITSSMSLNECYELITGYPQAEFEAKCEQMATEATRKKEEFKATIPQLIEKYTEEGKKYLSGDKLDLWRRILPIRFGDLYQGMEIKCTLEILKALEEFEEVDQACVIIVNKILESQGHSGMSYGLMKFMLKEFNKFGTDLTSKLD